MALQVEPLAYPHDALEPWIDRMTMEIHHGKHYATYVSNYNKALEQAPQLVDKPLEQVLADNLSTVPEAIRTAVRNNGGGAINHAMFWQIMGPRAGGRPSGNIARIIDSVFGSFDSFKEKFKAAALGRFGSGWAWLIKKGDRFEITSTANQDSPIMEGSYPVLGLDVWEHAYYLKYQNRRADYVDAWWNVVNWAAVEKRLNQAK